MNECLTTPQHKNVLAIVCYRIYNTHLDNHGPTCQELLPPCSSSGLASGVLYSSTAVASPSWSSLLRSFAWTRGDGFCVFLSFRPVWWRLAVPRSDCCLRLGALNYNLPDLSDLAHLRNPVQMNRYYLFSIICITLFGDRFLKTNQILPSTPRVLCLIVSS